MTKLLSEVKLYYSNVISYFSGFICALCSAKSKLYFEFKNGNFIIRYSPNACRGIYRWWKFSFKMIATFNGVIFPLVEYFKCLNNKMEDPHYALYLIPDIYSVKLNNIKLCYEDPDIYDSKCKKLCSSSFENFSIKLDFIKNYKQALKGILLIL